jgi:Fe-S-cluster-containing dehydrogenase component/CRP-like cAMP-binding protein
VSAALTLPSFPESVWSTPALRGLDARARREIEAAGSVLDRRAGDVIHRPGDPADSLYVVTSGTVSVRVTPRGHAAVEVRRSGPGETFGEEAIVRLAGLRQSEATCVERARIAVIPAAVLRRAAERAGRDEVAERRMRAMRRAAVRDVLVMLAFTRELSEADRDIVLDAIKPMEAPRATIVMRAGDRAESVFFVADGMLQLQQEDEDGTVHSLAYLVRGDVFGDEDVLRHAHTAVAVGPSWVFRLPRAVFSKLARANPEAASHAKRAPEERAQPVDLYRLDVARSLLVIDQDACVRCGHCAASCSDAHTDGVARLVRRGDKVRLRVVSGETKSLLVPTSCQHCSNPACLVDCPTGAITRTDRGEVVIREDLCTGCGNCAKACPWDNIQMAENPAGRLIAAKCDLCSARSGGPACVEACPTQAIARIDPAEVLDDVRTLPQEHRHAVLRTGPLEPAPPAWPWIVGALAIGASAALFRTDILTSGIATGAGIVALAGYGVVKRIGPRIWARARRIPNRSRVRPHFVAHLAIGSITSGFAVAHAGAHVPWNVAGALWIAFVMTAWTGLFGALAYALLPSRLARLERKGALPEDFAARARSAGEDVFRALTGSSEVLKAVYARVFRPYERALGGGLRVLVRGRSLEAEERSLLHDVRSILGDKATPERMRPISELARTLVEQRAISAQRIGHVLLRAWLVVHLACTGACLVLLAIHAWDAWRFH